MCVKSIVLFKKKIWTFLLYSCDVLGSLREISHHSGSGQESTYICLIVGVARSPVDHLGSWSYLGQSTAFPANWAQVYCGCQPGLTRLALHPGRMVEVPERQPYVHWTSTYNVFEEMWNMWMYSCTSPRPARGHDLVDLGITSTSCH